MKCEFKTDYEDKKSFAWSLTISLMLIVISCNALTSDNPYSTIFSRNVFALKPPQPVLPPTIALVVVPAGIDLQGFTTILGRPQVLLKVKIPPRPPEPAKDQFMVMDVGQREGDVEVLEIDAYAGVVKIRNQGNLLTLTLKENGLKPAEGPAIPVAANLGVPKIPGFAPSNIPSVNGNVNAAPSLGVPQSQSLPPAPRCLQSPSFLHAQFVPEFLVNQVKQNHSPLCNKLPLWK